jgi:hypothetical protein
MRGSIRKRGADSWEIQIELERIGGKRRRRFVSIKGSYKDAQRKLNELLSSADAGTLPDSSNWTVDKYLCQYLDSATHISPKTRESYRELTERQITWARSGSRSFAPNILRHGTPHYWRPGSRREL